jgi:hypothetical protein
MNTDNFSFSITTEMWIRIKLNSDPNKIRIKRQDKEKLLGSRMKPIRILISGHPDPDVDSSYVHITKLELAS